MSIPQRRLSATDAYRQAVERAVLEHEFSGGLDARVFAAITVGGGTVTHVAAQAAALVQASTASGDRALLRSHARPRAAAGRGRSVVIVGHVSALVTNQQKRWGLFSDDDGYFFQLDGETLSIVRRSKVSGSIVDVAVANPQWNASTAAKSPVDTTKTHVYEIREAWPNSDAQFFVDGVHVHTMSTDGSVVGPAGVKARLPLSVEVTNSAAASAQGSFAAIAASVLVEEEPRPRRRGGAHGSEAAVSTSALLLLAIRAKATFNSVANLGELVLERLTAMASGECLIQVLAGPTVSGASWAELDATSLAEVTTAGTLSGGVVVREFAFTGDLDESLDEVVRLLADDSQDVLAITATRLGGSDVSAHAALTWREIR
jgi:hypothetical protein